MTRPRVRLAGPVDRLRIEHADRSSRVRAPEVEALVEAEWERQLAVARAAGTPYADADAYRLESATRDDDGVTLSLSLERYRVHAAMKTLHADPRVRPEHHDRLLVADALVRTRDGQVLLQRLPKVAGVTTELVGGTCAPHLWPMPDADALRGYVAARASRGLQVAAGAVEVGPLLGLVDHVVGCVCAVFEVSVDATAAAVVAGRTAPGDLVVVPEAEAVSYLAASTGYLPAVAELVGAGRGAGALGSGA